MKNRPHTWPSLLASHGASRAWMPFEWGRNDCVHFAADWLRLLGYADPLAGFGAWSSALGAAREIRAHGGFEQAVSERMALLGCPPVPIRAAHRGDLVLLQIDARRQALGVVAGSITLAPDTNGLRCHPTLPHALRAWSV